MTVSNANRQARRRTTRADAQPSPKRPQKPMKFVVYEDNGRQWRWRLVATGGSVLADSARHYGHRDGALAAALRIQSSAAGADVSVS
jgi:uncharacterized protein YegP (UPF0339 family)